MPKKFKREDSQYRDIMFKDVSVGDKFWDLTVVGFSDVRNNLLCKCECGKEVRSDFYNIRTGASKSCGCLSVKNCKENFSTHNLRTHPLYSIWAGMKNRCLNKNEPAYKNYGGRGVGICSEWVNDFVSFKTWAESHGYNKKLTLDRVDTNGDYSPDNCRWATASVQSSNRRANKNKVLPKGVSKKGNRYVARIMQDKVAYHLGVYDTPEQAFAIYKNEAINRFGVCYEAVR